MRAQAKKFRAKAEEARAVAVELQDREAQLIMLDIASGYDHLADFCERSIPELGAAGSPNPAHSSH